jgi:hypothetical protein
LDIGALAEIRFASFFLGCSFSFCGQPQPVLILGSPSAKSIAALSRPDMAKEAACSLQ